MIIGVPIFAVIYAAAKSIINTQLQKKSMPTETKSYENLDYIDETGFHEQSSESPKQLHFLIHKSIKFPEKDSEVKDTLNHEAMVSEDQVLGKEPGKEQKK